MKQETFEYKDQPDEGDLVIAIELTTELLGEYVAGGLGPALCENPLPKRYKFRSCYPLPYENRFVCIFSTDDAPEGVQAVRINTRTYKIVDDCLSKQRVREAILQQEVGVDPKYLLKELGLEE